MQRWVFLAILGIVSQGVRADCLPDATLEELGYTFGNFTKPKIFENSTLCTSVIRNVGICVDPLLLNAKVYNDLRTFTAKFSVVNEFDSLLDVLYQNMTMNGNELTEGQISTFNSTFARLKTELEKNYKNCFTVLAKVQMGVNCLLASGKASLFASRNETVLQVLANPNLGSDLDAVCLPVFDAMCLLSTGQMLTSNLTIKASYAEADVGVVRSCRKMINYTECDGLSCYTKKQQELVESLVMPFEYELYPPKKYLENLRNSIQEQYLSLLTPHSEVDVAELQVRIWAEAGGEDLVYHGENSGVKLLESLNTLGGPPTMSALLLVCILLFLI